MTHLPQRLLNVLLGLDETLNTLLGGRPRETVSGTIGRAASGLRPPWWAKAAAWVVDGVLGQHHCAMQAIYEQQRRDAESVSRHI